MTPNDGRKFAPKKYLDQIKERIYSTEHALLFELKDGTILKLRFFYTKEKSRQLIAKLKELKHYKWMPHIHDIGYKGDMFWYVIDRVKHVADKTECAIDDCAYDVFYKYAFVEEEKSEKMCYWESELGTQLFNVILDIHKYGYDDIHGGNIMVDNQGNYKVIDLESFTPGGQERMS